MPLSTGVVLCQHALERGQFSNISLAEVSPKMSWEEVNLGVRYENSETVANSRMKENCILGIN